MRNAFGGIFLLTEPGSCVTGVTVMWPARMMSSDSLRMVVPVNQDVSTVVACFALQLITDIVNEHSISTLKITEANFFTAFILGHGPEQATDLILVGH